MLSVDSKLDLASQNIVQIFELILRALMLTNLISEWYLCLFSPLLYGSNSQLPFKFVETPRQYHK